MSAASAAALALAFSSCCSLSPSCSMVAWPAASFWPSPAPRPWRFLQSRTSASTCQRRREPCSAAWRGSPWHTPPRRSSLSVRQPYVPCCGTCPASSLSPWPLALLEVAEVEVHLLDLFAQVGQGGGQGPLGLLSRSLAPSNFISCCPDVLDLSHDLSAILGNLGLHLVQLIHLL